MRAGQDGNYFIGRILQSLDMARDATTLTSRLIHLDLARRYTIAVGHSVKIPGAPFVRSFGPGKTSL